MAEKYFSDYTCFFGSFLFQVFSMEVSPNSKFLATGSNVGTVKVWSLAATSVGSLLAELSGLYKDTIVCLAFGQENRYIVVGAHCGKEQLLVWDFQRKNRRCGKILV